MTKPYILGVDDTPLNLLILDEILAGKFELECVTNGAECLASVAKRQPDLILMDINMPVMDGLEACKRLKSEHKTAKIPIIIVSASASKAEIAKGLATGADTYISKPFKEEILFKAIDNYLK